MMKTLLTELSKSKRTSIWIVTLITPSAVIIFSLVNLLLRKDYHVRKIAETGIDWWTYLFNSSSGLLILALPLGITMICSVITSMEHRAKAWKQLFALPISREKLFISKFLLATGFTLFSIFLVGIGYLLLGFGLGFVEPLPKWLLIKQCFYPFLASFPIIVVQLWLSTAIPNQAFAIIVGTVTSIGAIFLLVTDLPLLTWLPWTYPIRALPLRATENGLETNPEVSLVFFLSVLMGLILLWMFIKFNAKREIS
jgi:hypothetical protein